MTKQQENAILLASKVADWMIGDYGPFGRNDPTRFQNVFNKMTREYQMLFIINLTNQIQSRLMSEHILFNKRS